MLDQFFSNLSAHTSELLPDLRTALLGFNFLLSLPTNCYILRLLTWGRKIPSEFFFSNLTLCEIIYSIFFLNHLLQRRFPSLMFLQQFSLGLGFTGRPLFQCLMCVERYLAVVHPITFLKLKPLRYRLICCSASWLLTVALCFGCMMALRISDMGFAWLVATQFFLFLSVQMFCLMMVLRALKHSGPGERGREREGWSQMRRRSFMVIFINMVSLLIMFGPYTLAALLALLHQTGFSPGAVFWFFSLCCFTLAGFMPPVLFLHRVGKFAICFSKC